MNSLFISPQTTRAILCLKLNTMLLISFLSILFVLGSAENDGENEKKERKEAWRRAICEKNDQELFKDIDGCVQLHQKGVIDAFQECTKEALSSNGNVLEFLNAACKDASIFKKFDNCFAEYKANPAFKNQIKWTPEIQACYEEIFKNYSLESFRSFFNSTEES